MAICSDISFRDCLRGVGRQDLEMAHLLPRGLRQLGLLAARAAQSMVRTGAVTL
jgi:hypothetical protein